MTRKADNKAKAWAKTGVLISWTTFWLFLLLSFGILLWTGICFYLFNKKVSLWKYVLLSAWVFVPSCSFVTGSFNYFTGSATLKGVGSPQLYHGTDRETRAAVTTSGCISVGCVPFVNKGNTVAVALWTTLFSYKRGAYAGVYPTEAEAKKLLQTADTISVTRAGNFFRFHAGDQEVKLDTLDLSAFYYEAAPIDKVIGKVLNEECFLFRPTVTSPEFDKIGIFLLDINLRRVLAHYAAY